MIRYYSYKYKLGIFDNESYNLAVDEVYYVQSLTNEKTNDSVRALINEISELCLHGGEFFPYKFRYIGHYDDQNELLSLYPNVDKYLNNAESSEAKSQFQGCLICHLLPNQNADNENLGYLCVDLNNCPQTIVADIVKQFIDKINLFNRQALESYVDYYSKTEWEDFVVLNKESKTARFSLPTKGAGLGRLLQKFAMPAAKEAEDLLSECSDVNLCESINMAPGAFDAPCAEKSSYNLSAESDYLRQLANKIRRDIQELQRHNGINILIEQLNGDGLLALQQRLQPQPSKLIINDKFQFLLPEYDIEVKMPTLSKVVYILFLRHKEGVRLKELADYKDELRDIYLTISPRTQISTLLSSIDDLTDPQSGSANQKISRISSAFREHLATDIAQPYLIIGPRGEKRKINLNRELLELPSELTRK